MTNLTKLSLGKTIHSLFLAGGNAIYLNELADQVFGSSSNKDFDKAVVAVGQSNVVGWASELTTIQQLQQQFIELLRPRSLLYQLRDMALNLPFGIDGKITIPRQTTSTNSSWIGEGGAIKVSALSFDNIELTPKNNAVISVITDELLKRSDPGALDIVQSDVLNSISSGVDTTFTSNDAATATSPAGLQTFGTRTASVGNSLDNISSDLKDMTNRLLDTNLTMQKPVFLMSEANRNTLSWIRDGLGHRAFDDELKDNKLNGFDLISSNHVPSDIIILIDVSQLILSIDELPTLSLTGSSTLHMDDAPSDDLGGATTNVQNLFQTNCHGIRCISILDWNMRHPAVETLHTVSWS
ncbi:MAG: phage major capsid protein [gamma proteobacterium symbiont of Taylorina sp.]|nr:phage major capsid protein [gamma proteobacterium symbiont of Taylorina sp.]